MSEVGPYTMKLDGELLGGSFTTYGTSTIEVGHCVWIDGVEVSLVSFDTEHMIATVERTGRVSPYDVPVCTCHRSGSMFQEPEFECDVHGDRAAKAAMSVEEHAKASARAVLGAGGTDE